MAIADYTQAIRLNPEYAKAYNNRGATYRRKGDIDRAIADYTRAIGLDPDNAAPAELAKTYYNRGVAYYSKGDYRRALTEWEQALRINPSDTGVRDAVEALRRAGSEGITGRRH
ncbi:MAG: tetratricopeptide repeat protein [Treponema sp.]|nr:tetratricopeptide repeat protein [Treponema sp.]